VKLGEEIIIDAKTLKSGRSLAFLTIDIINKKDGSLVAQARHTKFIPKKEPQIPETNELYYLVF
jgi:acyl-coenzyme A thioesterase PaaI-like protein